MISSIVNKIDREDERKRDTKREERTLKRKRREGARIREDDFGWKETRRGSWRKRDRMSEEQRG
jgi:hypothetical protein